MTKGEIELFIVTRLWTYMYTLLSYRTCYHLLIYRTMKFNLSRTFIFKYLIHLALPHLTLPHLVPILSHLTLPPSHLTLLNQALLLYLHKIDRYFIYFISHPSIHPSIHPSFPFIPCKGLLLFVPPTRLNPTQIKPNPKQTESQTKINLEVSRQIDIYPDT